MQIEGRDPDRFAYLQYTNQTTIHPVGFACLIFAIIWVFASTRRNVVWPVVMLLCFVAPAQRIVLGGLDLPFMRIIVVIALLHAILTGGLKTLKGCWVDKAVGLMAFLPVMFAIIRGQLDVLSDYVGGGGNMLAYYLLGRVVVREFDDMRAFFRALAVAAIPSSLLFFNEYVTGRNMFSIFGGVNEITRMRMGELRCQGPFPHPLIAGVWWVTALPLIVSLWWSRQKSGLDGVLAIVGGSAAAFIVWVSNSSTTMTVLIGMPIMAAVYPLRRQFGRLAWIVLAIVLGLHFASGSGFHHLLFTRFSIISGSTGYHRYKLYDRAMSHFSEWAVVGTRSTYNWGWGLDDVTSELVLAALWGGSIGLILYVWLIVWSIRTSWQSTLRFEAETMKKVISYALGMAIIALAVTGLGVGFFGQADFMISFLFGIIPGLAILQPTKMLRRRSEPAMRPAEGRRS